MLFGAAPSQYRLNSVIRKHAEKYKEIDPNFERMVRLGFYVDDLNTSVKNCTDGINFYRKCKTRFAEGSFNIRKYRSNDPDVKRVFEEREEKLEILEYGKVLGITWDESTDQFVVRLSDFLPKTVMEVSTTPGVDSTSGYQDKNLIPTSMEIKS